MVTSLVSAATWRAKYLTAAAYQRALSTNRTAVVVGATSGIGEACAHRLAAQGFLVVAVGRDRPGRPEAMIEALTKASTKGTTASPSPSPSPQHEFYACDAFSLESVQRTAEKIQAKHPTIDALVMTQGMATTQGFTPTSEGNDEKMTLHYYSRMCMIQSLLPSLTASKLPAVVVSVLSGGVHSPYLHYADDPSLQTKYYSIQNVADAAGYYTDLGLDQLALENPTIRFVHAAPGFVNTNWGTEFHPILRGFVRLLQPFGKSAADCADSLMGSTVLAADAGDPMPDLPERIVYQGADTTKTTATTGGGGGVYIVGPNGETAALTKEHTNEARESVWNHTKEVLAKAGLKGL